MKITAHAYKRKQQRCISDFALEIIQNYGRIIPAAGGAERVFLGKKEYNDLTVQLRRTIKMLENAKGGSVIISKDHILTVYKDHSS
ncbi:MAG: hypothetical protein PHI97_19965 [Desulfobulbus sp.]|nr:hypothetical protein [Desulfobulbus sp.]